MKVLGVTPLYPPASRVGSWISTHECLAHLAAHGHDVEVIRAMIRPGPDYNLDGVQVHAGAHRVVELTARADVVISHLGDNGRAHRYALRFGKPSVRMAHGGKVSAEQIEEASLVVWNSDSYRKGRPGIVVHPPVWPDRYSTTPGDHVTLVNLSEDKGVKTMWRCAELLPDVKFLGVRGGTGHQVIPRSRNVEVQVTTSDMREVYGRTRLLLMPSAFETWGRVGVEAMASGIPVIAHPTPGLRESLGDAGIFVHRDDIEGWVEEIQRLQDPTEWAAASARALARSSELRPNLDLFVNAVEALTRQPAPV